MIDYFSSYIKESYVVEELKMKRTIEDIGDEFPYYDQMLKYLKEELTNKELKIIRFIGSGKKPEKVRIKVKKVDLSRKKLIFTIVSSENKRYVLQDKDRLIWTKEIKRYITSADPYGEDDWETNESVKISIFNQKMSYEELISKFKSFSPVSDYLNNKFAGKHIELTRKRKNDVVYLKFEKAITMVTGNFKKPVDIYIYDVFSKKYYEFYKGDIIKWEETKKYDPVLDPYGEDDWEN